MKAALKKSLARKKAEQEAARLLGELRQGKPLAQVAAAAGLAVKDSGFFTRFQGFQGQRQAEALTGAAFQLSQQHPYPEKPLWWQDQYYLLAFKARREPDPQEFQKERDQMRAQFLNQKQQLLFASWLDGERRRAKIQVFVKPRDEPVHRNGPGLWHTDLRRSLRRAGRRPHRRGKFVSDSAVTI